GKNNISTKTMVQIRILEYEITLQLLSIFPSLVRRLAMRRRKKSTANQDDDDE
ncbi:unnamed protein product, partial [Ceratitis capitata]